MDKNTFYKILILILIALISTIIVLILDYYGVLGFISSKLNYDFLNIYFNFLIIVVMFIITYNLVERKMLENEQKAVEREQEQIDNKKNILLIFLKEAYQLCLDEIKMIDNQHLLENYIVPKIDFNATKDKIMENISNLPFESDEYIIEIFTSGAINKSFFEEYLNIKNKYRSFINMRISFFDAEKSDRSDLVVYIDSLRTTLYESINNQQKRINQEIKREKQHTKK